MQKLIFLFLSLFLFTACSSKKEQSSIPFQQQVQIADYLNSSNKFQASIKEYEKIFQREKSLETALKLAYIYRYKVKEEDEMLKWYEEALALDCLTCKEELAYYYFLKKDLKEANKYKEIKVKPPTKKNINTIKYYKREFARKDLSAGFKLAQFYLDNLNDIKNAIAWYEYSYEMGYSHSAYFLAVLYDEKLKDYEKASTWYKKAYENGNISSKKKLVKIYKKYIPNLRQKFYWERK